MPNARSDTLTRPVVHGYPLSLEVVSGFVLASDAFAVLATDVAIYISYLGWSEDRFPIYLMASVVHALACVSLFKVANFYAFDSVVRPSQMLPRVLLACGAVFLVLVTLAFAFKLSAQFSRVWAFSSLVVGTSAILAGRIMCNQLLRAGARMGKVGRNIVLVGAGRQTQKLLDRLDVIHEPWFRIIGVFEDRGERVSHASVDVPILGSVDHLFTFARRHRIDDIIITLPWNADERISELVERFRELPVHIRLASDLVGYRYPRFSQSEIAGIPVLNVAHKPISGWLYLIKLVEDRILGALLFAGLLLPMALIAYLIKLDSPGPVFFKQQRYGFNRRIIEIYKFRTMSHVHSDQDAERLTSPEDPRVTTLGRFLRRFSLDELPQLVNVLRGEMSLVGPRPHALKAKAGGELYEDAVAKYATRHKVKPGLTGWAQVNGWRGETDSIHKLQKRVEHDLYYIDNWSLGLELRIILKTILVIMKGTNAY